MAEPEDIVAFLTEQLLKGQPLRGKKVLITAGPTHEAIDPVRFLGNHSSGTMGFELAKAAADLGAEVVLVSGPSNCSLENRPITLLKVISAEEMYQAVHSHYGSMDIVICAAAVADYRPKQVAVQKIKKKEDGMVLKLVKTRDILLSLGEQKTGQFLVGFALETENGTKNAEDKLKRKNLDAIVLNSLTDPGAGFGTHTNKISFIDKNLQLKTFALKTKAAVALDIMNEIIDRIHA
jgi:phosphopantothenoylcysteine decarboxylase/phosphopantothenate--cysteine ligase